MATVENISISVKTNADKAASKLSSLVSAMENVKKAANNMVEGTGDISVSISRAAKKAEKEFEPLSSEMQKAIKDANKYQVLVHKAADASVKMGKAFEKGNEAAAWREREKEINATAQAQKEFLKNQPKIAPKPVSSEIQEFLTNANAIDLLKFRIESLNAEMQKAFQSGDANKAANYRQQIINATAALQKQEEALKGVEEQSKKTEKHHNKFLASIKRIAMYRMLRTALKEITQGFNEGLKNAYNFSKGINGSLAVALDNLATKSLTMKNQMGAAFGALLQAIMPIIMQIISAITALMQALSAIFAAIGGGQYLVAKDVAQSWDKATGAANKYKNTILGFDEINRLDEPSGGGAGDLLNLKDMFEEGELPSWAQKIKDIIDEFKKEFGDDIEEFKMRLKFNVNDVLFNWKNLTGEQIAKKVIAALAGVVGASVGFMVGGVPGAVVGTLIGVGLGLVIDSIIFNNDGTLSAEEILSMICVVAGAIAGGVLGFFVGGPSGAAIGITVGAGLALLTSGLIFDDDGKVEQNEILGLVCTVAGALVGGIIGFEIGGPGGAFVGAIVGTGISLLTSSLIFEDGTNNIRDAVLQTLIITLTTITGGLIGFAVGGMAGAVIGATVGSALGLIVDYVAFRDGEKDQDVLTATLVTTLTVMFGTIIGFKVGGPAGAVIGASIGVGIGLLVKSVLFGQDETAQTIGILNSLVVVLGALAGAAIGFAVGGPLGAAIGATVGVGVTLVATSVNWSQNSKTAFDKAHSDIGAYQQEYGFFGEAVRGNALGYASGGTIENNGSLFIAGEAGPEIVANMGNRTGVMNVEQMETAVANGNIGVINAIYGMANAIVNAVESIDPDITLDGESLADKMYHYNQNAANRHGAAMVT